MTYRQEHMCILKKKQQHDMAARRQPPLRHKISCEFGLSYRFLGSHDTDNDNDYVHISLRPMLNYLRLDVVITTIVVDHYRVCVLTNSQVNIQCRFQQDPNLN